MAPLTLITGATGFIGTTLARQLIAGGQPVRALVRSSSRTEMLERLGVELAIGDLADPASIARAVEGCERVVHLAGIVKALEGRDFFRQNTDGTRHVAETCAGAARPPLLIYVSSLSAAGPSLDGRPRVEDDPSSPVSLYGESKLAGERAVRGCAERIAASIVRPPIVYGPGDHELVPQLVRMARMRLILRPGLEQKRYSVIHVEDLCRGIVAIAERGQRLRSTGSEGLYYLDDGVEHTWDDIAQTACRAWGVQAFSVPLPEVMGQLVAAGSSIVSAFTRKPAIFSVDKMREIHHSAWTCSSDRARRELGWSPQISLAEGMRQSMEWMRAGAERAT